MKIKVDEVEAGMTIESEDKRVKVYETFTQQGEGLGTVIRGVDRNSGRWLFMRFMYPEDEVELVEE